ncbi:MAG: S49 family peptidase, partial [Actinomycetota bacterium]
VAFGPGGGGCAAGLPAGGLAGFGGGGWEAGPPGPGGGRSPAGNPAAQPPPPGPNATPQPGPQAGAPAGGQPAFQPVRQNQGPEGMAWYNGPVPISSLAPRETIGSAIGRTLVKAIVGLAVLLLALFLIPLTLIGVGAALGGGGAEIDGTPRSLVAGEARADVRLVAIPITGVILGEDRGAGGGLFSAIDATYGYTIKEELEELADDPTVDGIILELDTPGGTIFGSRAIADGVADYQEATGNPVIAYVGGISASGGMYAMAGADEIYADHGTLIGSIGVIFGPFQTFNDVTAIDGGILGGGVTTEGGIEFEFLTAGRSKDFGNPYRPMTDEERAVLQEGLDNAYDDFVQWVADGRGLSTNDIEQDLGALIFGEHQAMANGLIDGIANRDATYELAAEAAGLSDGETWGVERLDGPETSLLGLLADATVGADDQAEADAVTAGLGSAHPLCLGTGTMLAYHGDPTQLCAPGP